MNTCGHHIHCLATDKDELQAVVPCHHIPAAETAACKMPQPEAEEKFVSGLQPAIRALC